MNKEEILKKIINQSREELEIWERLLEEDSSKYIGDKLMEEQKIHTKFVNEEKVKIEAFKNELKNMELINYIICNSCHREKVKYEVWQRSIENAEYVCPNCYQSQQSSAMEFGECVSVMNHMKSCAKCRADIIKNGEEI